MELDEWGGGKGLGEIREGENHDHNLMHQKHFNRKYKINRQADRHIFQGYKCHYCVTENILPCCSLLWFLDLIAGKVC